MAIECAEVIKQCLETLAEGFHCQPYGDILIVTTPYLYHDGDMIYVAVKELPRGMVHVCDQGEAVMHPFSHGFDLARIPWGMEAAREIAQDEFVELDGGMLSKTGPAQELGQTIQAVVMAARGVSDLLYAHRAYARITRNRPDAKIPYRYDEGEISFVGKAAYSAFLVRLEVFLRENKMDFVASPTLIGNSGQHYTVDYQLNEIAYLHTRNPVRAAYAKAHVDRTFGLWADCNGALTRERKLTLLNDETLTWKAAHIHRLSQVSTVIKWSERDKLPALLAALS